MRRSDEKAPRVVPKSNVCESLLSSNPFPAAEIKHIKQETIANIAINMKIVDECLRNLKYRHIPTPSCWNWDSGGKELQQQNLPGLKEQHDSQHPYF